MSQPSEAISLCMKHCKHVLWRQEKKYTARNKADVATVLVNPMFPFISSAVTGKVEVMFCS
jgi:hypothetical protein